MDSRQSRHYGVIARFDSGEDLLAATLSAHAAGFRNMEAHAPFPLPGLAEALGFCEEGLKYSIPRIALAAGLISAAIAFLLQWYTAVIDYPIVVSGKPLNSWPAFLPITFKVGIFNTVMAATITMLVKSRLPRYYHPVFNEDDFAHASADGFFLTIRARQTADIEALLREHRAQYVRELVW